MFRIKRGILLLLVLLLLPFNSAQAKPQVESNYLFWRGTIIVKWVHRARWVLPGTYFPIRGKLEEYYTRTIYPDGYGNATQEIEYSYLYYQEAECNGEVGFYRKTGNNAFSVGPAPFNLAITDYQVTPEFLQPGLYVDYKHEYQCGTGTEQQLEIVDYDAVSLSPDDGEFSPTSFLVHGADRYGMYTPSYAGNTGWDSTIFVTVYDLVLFDSENHYFSGTTKDALRKSAAFWGWEGEANGFAAQYVTQKYPEKLALKRALGVIGVSAELAGLIDRTLAKDPPDLNYTEIALPVTPTTSDQPITAGGGLTQAQAGAFNALLANLQQGIGLGRAMVTCFNRATGAQQANDNYWFGQQLQASRTYAGQLAALLSGRPQLMENLRLALQADPDLSFDISAQDLAQYQYDLVVNGLSSEVEQYLTEMGVDASGRADILFAAILTEAPPETLLQDPVIAQFPGLLNNPGLTQSTQALASALFDYSEGMGWKIYIPAVTR